MVKPLQLGKNVRMSYSRIPDVIEMPYLVEVQKNSYAWFLKEGLMEIFRDVSPITDYTGNLILEFVDYSLDDNPKYSVEECKERDATYAAPLRVKVRLINKETGEVKEQEIFMGDFPLMTENGTFIINGAERVVVSQLVRSAGTYFDDEIDKTGKKLFSTTIIPNRGAWLEYETDSNDILYIRIDRTRKLPLTVLVRALGYGTDIEIINLYGEDERLLATIQKDNSKTVEEGLIEIYKRLRPGEPPTVESATTLLKNLFFDSKRYDLAKVGRFKFNSKLSVANRIQRGKLFENVIDPSTGEVIASKGDAIPRDLALKIQNAGINEVLLDVDGRPVKVVGNKMVDISSFVDFNAAELGVYEYVKYDVLRNLLDENTTQEKLKDAISKSIDILIPKSISPEDIIASISYLIGLEYGIGHIDDTDHLGNKRLRSVGELLQNQFRIGLSRMERAVRERMTIQDIDIATPQALINIRPVAASIKEFFGSSQLSQFMDQTNPLAELTHKRRLSALGPGGLSRERAGFEVRDVHHSHYGRMCPIETPEGPNIGLIGYLATYAKVNPFGFIESPYRKVDKVTGKVTKEIVYLTADKEDFYLVAQATEPLDAEGRFVNKRIVARFKEEILEVEPSRIDFMDIAPKQIVSIATAMIPFLENDDANRALMGANMQRQAVPLVKTDSPIVGTGIEYKAAKDSGVVVLSKQDGVVDKVTGNHITIKGKDGKKVSHKLLKYVRSNQGTCINQRPIVKQGEEVKAGDVIADGPATDNGEIALGRNILIGFMTWEGYNYEDAILINEKLVKNDVFTSIHIEEYESEARDTKLGPEEMTRDIPNISEEALKDLDERGIIRIGAEVRSGDILVGKVTPKGETELTAEERLLRAIFGEKAREVRDTSLRVPHGESGIIVDVKVFTRENGDELSPGVNQLVRVYIAQKRKISVGDKMAGRHGNKGVISRILPEEDMPFLPDGTPLEIVLNPLGVPSRMNIGQVLEVHLGYAAKALGWKIATPVFDGATELDIRKTLMKAGIGYDPIKRDAFEIKKNQFKGSRDEFEGSKNKLKEEEAKTKEAQFEVQAKKLEEEELSLYDGKATLYDGRTGEPFDNRVTVGYMYILKLAHLVDDKIHARSTGPYSLVTQQPLGGKAQFGGQRFGEMEVWALEAYGAAYTLQEILTVKSDDVVGRVKTYEAIVKGENIPEPGIPESFKVLIKELQSLCLDVKVYSEEREEIALKESPEDEFEELNVNIEGREDEEIFNEFLNVDESEMLIESEDDFDAEITGNEELEDSLGEGLFSDDEEDFEEEFEEEIEEELEDNEF